MGLFDSVAGTFFNTATSAYKTVVQPVVSTATQAVQTVTKPVVQGSYSTGATQQVAVQPKPPIVTSVANQNTLPAQQALAQASGSPVITTQQVTPQGQTVYVSSRASPIQPEPVIISRPVQVQAPSIVDVTGALIPGAGLALAARTISGDPQVIQNAAMDITGLRQQTIQNQQASLQARNEALIARNEALTQTSLNQRAALEQQVIGFEQKKQQLQQRVSQFESLGPATSIEDYNTRLNEYNLLTSDISALNLEGERINADAVAANRNLVREQIGILNTRDQLQAEGTNLNVQAANIGTTGLAGLTTGFDLRVNKPISDALLTGIGKPFGMSKEDVALGLQLNRQVSEGMVTFGGPSIQNIGAAYGAGMVQDTLMKPGEALFWTGVGIATGGATRALGPGIEGLAAAARAPGASVATRALGAGVRIAPIAMGGLFVGSVGLDVASQGTSGKMVSRLGGLTATEILPMIGGGIVGYRAPEILSGAAKTMRGFGGGIRTGELGEIATELRGIPAISRRSPSTSELSQIGAELRSIPTRQPVFEPTTAFERPIGGKQPRIERITEAQVQDDFLRLNYEPFEQAGKVTKPAVGLTREQLLPVPVNPELSFVDFTKPVRPVPVASQRLTPVYEVVSGQPGKYAFRGFQGQTNPLEGAPLAAVYEDIFSTKVLKFNQAKGAFEPTLSGRGWSRTMTEYGLPKADIFSPPAVESLGTGKVFGPVKPARTPIGKSMDVMLGRPSEQLKAYGSYAGWEGGMQSALGGGGKMEFRGGGLVSIGETPTATATRDVPQFVKFYPRQDTSGVVGIGVSEAALNRASAANIGAASLALFGTAGREMGALVGKSSPDAYNLFLLQVKYEKEFGIGAIPASPITIGQFDAAADNRRYYGGLPTIAVQKTQPFDFRDVADFTGMKIDTTSRRQGPVSIPTRMLTPVEITGGADITDLSFRVTPIFTQTPDLMITPETRIIQAPDQRITTQLINQEILITTPEIPVYSPPEYILEIPPIPPPIIPGFPVAGGGGGGGGGFGGQGGFLFEESWLAGGNEDPFGVGKMNFDVGTLSGVSTGTTGRKRRRR